MTDFRRSVYAVVKQIPKGKVATYGQVARSLGNPKAARAVGTALAGNTDPQAVPCHRVVRTDGNVGEYAFGGTHAKREKLIGEGVKFSSKDLVDLSASQATL